jgi:hypothetical protein
MAVKYVKDFAFDSGFGYTGSAGKTPVRGYNRGGKVFDNSTRNPISKFPELAPAMVGKGPGKMGGKTSDVAPMSTAKANPQIAKYAKGGKVKKPPMAKPMKAKMMKKAEGGPVAEITPSDGMSPLQAMASSNRPGRDEFGQPIIYDMPEELPLPNVYDMIREGHDAIRSEPVGALTPLPEEPNYGAPSRPGRDPFGQPIIYDMPRVPLAGDDGMVPGTLRDMYNRTAPSRPGRDAFGQPIIYDMPGDVSGMPPPAANRREAAMQRIAELRAKAAQSSAANRARTAGIRAMLAKNRPMVEEARSTRDSILAGMSPEKRAATQARFAQNRANSARGIAESKARRLAESKARRAMPVAPREPMIQLPRAPQGGIMTYAKGGKVSKGEQKIGKVMGEYKRGELHSGSKKGPVVTNPKQAKAIALSEARAAGAKIPKKAMGGKACG